MDAKATNRKNSVPNSAPAGIWANKLGKVINNNGMPAFGATPKAKAVGNTIKAAKMAAKVSKRAVYAAACGMSAFLGR